MIQCIRIIQKTDVKFIEPKTSSGSGFHRFQSFVVPRGFEPRHTESKSVVLPLYYGTKECKCNVRNKKYQMIFKA